MALIILDRKEVRIPASTKHIHIIFKHISGKRYGISENENKNHCCFISTRSDTEPLNHPGTTCADTRQNLYGRLRLLRWTNLKVEICMYIMTHTTEKVIEGKYLSGFHLTTK